jgi:hypothetical protein
MCFYNDYEWCASVWEETEGNLDSSATCDECGRKILPGEWRRHIYQQEDETCSVCEYEEPGEPCEVCDYGETYDYDRCQACEWILEAVESVEEEAGCPPDSRRPMLGEMRQSMWDNREEGRRYLQRAITNHAVVALAPWVIHFMHETSKPVETWP